MKENLNPTDVTQELIDAVYNLIEAQAFAKTMRKEVSEIEREVLSETPLLNQGNRGPEQITNPSQTYLAVETEAYTAFASEVDRRLREANLKPDDMALEYCPALVAEAEKHEAELAVFNEAATMLDVFDGDGKELGNRLLCQPDGLEKRQEFLDVACKLVISLVEG
jgi:hypothetical protein